MARVKGDRVIADGYEGKSKMLKYGPLLLATHPGLDRPARVPTVDGPLACPHCRRTANTCPHCRRTARLLGRLGGPDAQGGE